MFYNIFNFSSVEWLVFCLKGQDQIEKTAVPSHPVGAGNKRQIDQNDQADDFLPQNQQQIHDGSSFRGALQSVHSRPAGISRSSESSIYARYRSSGIPPIMLSNLISQLQMMIDLKTTVIAATSSYALLLSEEITKRGLRDQIFLKKGVIGSERWSETMRQTIRRNLGISLYDIYGLTEIYGPGIGISCDEENGMHYWDDYIFIEIIDPVTGENVPDGESGEIVITTLVKEGAPLLRFRTHDLSRIIPGECKCGSKYPRLDIISGRSDDMFKIHGVNLFPSQIEAILGMVDGVGSEYRIILARDNDTKKDVLHITAEAEGRVDFAQTGMSLTKLCKSRLGVTPKIAIVPVGSLARSEKKTKRVDDQRS